MRIFNLVLTLAASFLLLSILIPNANAYLDKPSWQKGEF